MTHVLRGKYPGHPLVLGLGIVALLLSCAHFAAVVVDGERIPRLVDLDSEANPAAWFSSGLHIVNAALLGVIALAASRDRWRWWLLAVLVLAVSVDETVGLHERLGWALQQAFHTSGALLFAWVIPGVLLVTVVAVLCTRMIAAVTGGRLVLLGAAIFVTGAAGLEMIESARVSALEHGDTLNKVLAGAEETMEMFGAITTMAGLLQAAHGSGLRIVIESER